MGRREETHLEIPCAISRRRRWKGSLHDEQLSGILVATDFTESDSSASGVLKEKDERRGMG
jgi:hypothetical protein